MNSRNVLLLLSVVFVLVLIWNVLYFTGVVGDFGTESVQQQLPPSQFDNIPGVPSGARSAAVAQRPRAAGAGAGAGQVQVAGPRDTLDCKAAEVLSQVPHRDFLPGLTAVDRLLAQKEVIEPVT